jgi:hypothetical protein
MNRTPVSVLVAATLAVALLCVPRPGRCAWPHDPGANQPICTAVASQARPAVVSDAEGGAIIAWMDGRDDGGRALPAGLYFVRLATDGRTLVSRLAVIR